MLKSTPKLYFVYNILHKQTALLKLQTRNIEWHRDGSREFVAFPETDQIYINNFFVLIWKLQSFQMMTLQ